MKVISFVNMKGGVGKSTLAINVAHCLSDRLSKKILVIDIDPQFNATQCLLNPLAYMKHMQDKKDTILDIFSDEKIHVGTVSGVTEKENKKLCDIVPTLISNNLYLLPGNLSLYRFEMKNGEGTEFKLKRFLQDISESHTFDYVIIDTPPTPSVWMSSALIASDYYIIPVKPDPLSVTGIDLLDGIIQSRKTNYDLNLRCLGIVMNMVEIKTDIYKDTKSYIEQSNKWKKHLLRSSIAKRTAIAKHQTKGKHILYLNDGPLKLSLVQLVDEIIEKIDEGE